MKPSITVMLFATKIKQEVVDLVEEICAEPGANFTHIEDVRSHSIKLISLESGNNTSMNYVIGAMMNKLKLNIESVCYDSEANITYVPISQPSSLFDKSDVAKVTRLF